VGERVAAGRVRGELRQFNVSTHLGSSKVSALALHEPFQCGMRSAESVVVLVLVLVVVLVLLVVAPGATLLRFKGSTHV
jgi:hypothetical protein